MRRSASPSPNASARMPKGEACEVADVALKKAFALISELRKPLLRLVVPHHNRPRLPLADDPHRFLAKGHAPVNQVALQQQLMLRSHPDWQCGCTLSAEAC